MYYVLKIVLYLKKSLKIVKYLHITPNKIISYVFIYILD